MTSVNPVSSQNIKVSDSNDNVGSDADSNIDASAEPITLQEFNRLNRDGERDGLDYYESTQDDVRGVFSNLENTREYVVVNGNDATIDTGRGDDAAYLEGDNNSVTFGNGSDVGGTLGKNGFVMGESGSDELYAIGEHSAAYGGTGNDYVEVSGQSAVGYGDQGNDRIITQGSGAYGFGGVDDDTLIAAGTRGFVAGESGDDKLILSGLDNTAKGGEGNDKIALLNRGVADGGVGDDSFLLANDAVGSVVSGGEGEDSVFLEIAFDGDIPWELDVPDLGNDGDSSLTINGRGYTLSGVENIYFADGKSVKYDGEKWGVSADPAPSVPDTLELDPLERVTESHLEAENPELSTFDEGLDNSASPNATIQSTSKVSDSAGVRAETSVDSVKNTGIDTNSKNGSESVKADLYKVMGWPELPADRPERIVRDNTGDTIRQGKIAEWGIPALDAKGRPYELFPDGTIMYVVPGLVTAGGVDSDGRTYQIDYDGKPTYYNTLTGLPLNNDEAF